MSILIACDCRQTATKLQYAVTQFGQVCPTENVVTIENSLHSALGQRSSLRLVLFVLPDDHSRALHQIQLLRAKSEIPIAVAGPAVNPSCILNALHAGADHFIDSNGDLPQQLHHYLFRSRRTSAPAVAGKLIATISPCGGSGVSVITANLAAAYAQQQKSSTLLDFSIGRGDQAALFNLTARHHLNDLCENIDSLDQNILEQSLTHHTSGVRLLAANEEILDHERSYQVGLRQICQLVKQSFPCSFIDYPITYREDRIGVLHECDSIIVAIRPDFTSLKNLGYMIVYLDRINIDPAKIHVVANRTGAPQELPVSQLQYGSGQRVHLTIDDAPNLINASVNCGNPAVLSSPQSPFAASIRRLSEAVCPTEAAPARIRKSIWRMNFLQAK